ncbi:hypothetical protein [Paraburkholderia sp. C35]|uniref:hypothetical protein n=1 Tax=Paraburkholderia sp. C35 TaxID=2126993 RepID=UPI000D68EC30|nr:hypothetical protein [Paraburkholderia sp. C35]
MNNSLVEHQAVEAAQHSIANALSQVDKPDKCIRPKSEYLELFSQHCRVPYNVAKVFSHLVMRNQRNKSGDNPARLEVQREGGRWGNRAFWWLTTYEEIASACALSVDQTRTALQILERLNQVEMHRGRHPVNGQVIKYRAKTVLHIRLILAGRSNGLDGWPSSSQMRIILGWDKAQLINWDKAQPLLPDAVEGLDTEELNIQNGDSLTLTPESLSEYASKGAGKVKTQKKERASEPFLKICLERKLEFITLNDNGENTPCVKGELTADDERTAQRLEHELKNAGIDPLAFMAWLTNPRYQHIVLIDMWSAGDWSLSMIMSHRQTFIDKYRKHLDNERTFTPTSAQQMKLIAMAPAGMKLDIPLYERDLQTAIGLFSWDQHWLDHQEGGQWGGRTRLEHLRKYSKYQPEMESWLDNEPILSRVLELMAVAH